MSQVRIRLSLAGLIVAMGTLVAGPAFAQADGGATFVEGRHYRELATQRLWGDGDKVEVAEVFWYGCPHCFRLEPRVSEWVADNEGRIDFVRVPAQLNPSWGVHARAFFTARVLGVVDDTHKPLFDAIHEKGRSLDSRTALREFFTAHGVDREAFGEAWDSFAVETKLNRANQLVRAWGVTGVPAIVVDGRYVVSQVPQKMVFKVVDFLVEKAREE